VKPVKFHELATGSLFRIFSERKVVYDRCERVERFVRSKDFTVFKKHGSSHSSSKDGKVIILSPHDLVTEYVKGGHK
jgi:hypothetical protein